MEVGEVAEAVKDVETVDVVEVDAHADSVDTLSSDELESSRSQIIVNFRSK